LEWLEKSEADRALPPAIVSEAAAVAEIDLHKQIESVEMGVAADEERNLADWHGAVWIPIGEGTAVSRAVPRPTDG